MTERKALALTPSPLPACTRLCSGRKNSHLKQLGIKAPAGFVQWAAETRHCSVAHSIGPSELQYHRPVAIPGYRQRVVCSALDQERPPSAFPGWAVRVLVASQKRDILYYRYLSIFFKPGKDSLNPEVIFWHACYDLIFKRPMRHI